MSHTKIYGANCRHLLPTASIRSWGTSCSPAKKTRAVPPHPHTAIKIQRWDRCLFIKNPVRRRQMEKLQNRIQQAKIRVE